MGSTLYYYYYFVKCACLHGSPYIQSSALSYGLCSRRGNAVKPAVHVNKLDDALLLIIFNALPLLKDIARAACVCKRWNRILGEVSGIRRSESCSAR